MLQGDHILSHWLNAGRTLTQSNRPSIFRTTATNSDNRKDSDPHRLVTGTCRHVMEKHCRTDYQYENSCACVHDQRISPPEKMGEGGGGDALSDFQLFTTYEISQVWKQIFNSGINLRSKISMLVAVIQGHSRLR